MAVQTVEIWLLVIFIRLLLVHAVSLKGHNLCYNIIQFSESIKGAIVRGFNLLHCMANYRHLVWSLFCCY